MAEYLKVKEAFGGTNGEIIIQPTTINGEEKFSIWDNKEKKFIREGETIEVDGDTKEVNKYIKLTDEQKKRWQRNLKISRTVIYDGNEVIYDMPPSVNEQLEQVMDTIKSMDNNPLDFQYKVTRTKTGDNLWNVEYKVSSAGKHSVSPSIPEPELELEVEEQESLNALEEKIVQQIKKKYPDYAHRPKTQFIAPIAKAANCSSSRAEYIVDNYLLND